LDAAHKVLLKTTSLFATLIPDPATAELIKRQDEVVSESSGPNVPFEKLDAVCQVAASFGNKLGSFFVLFSDFFSGAVLWLTWSENGD
jgi:hypothetical protein